MQPIDDRYTHLSDGGHLVALVQRTPLLPALQKVQVLLPEGCRRRVATTTHAQSHQHVQSEKLFRESQSFSQVPLPVLAVPGPRFIRTLNRVSSASQEMVREIKIILYYNVSSDSPLSPFSSTPPWVLTPHAEGPTRMRRSCRPLPLAPSYQLPQPQTVEPSQGTGATAQGWHSSAALPPVPLNEFQKRHLG